MDQPSSYHTQAEIDSQAALWNEVYQLLSSYKTDIQHFLTPIFSNPSLEIILTGAGSSFFIGEVVATHVQMNTGFISRAIPTTDIVTHPEDYFTSGRPLLMISFARSGNSPESLASIALANLLCENVHHLVITCNKEGKLALLRAGNTYVIQLPPASNDQGLAMTSSVTSMILTALLVSDLDNIAANRARVDLSITYAKKVLNGYRSLLLKLSKLNFKRIVCLGSGPQLGVAREAHLKVEELTNGEVIGKFDSFLGFRHGPLAVVNSDTLIIYFVSNDPYVQEYERDLIKSVSEKSETLSTVVVSETKVASEADNHIYLSDHHEGLNEAYLSLSYLIVPQLIGMYKSINMGLNPDNPSVDGTINRVVQGVTIYDYSSEND